MTSWAQHLTQWLCYSDWSIEIEMLEKSSLVWSKRHGIHRYRRELLRNQAWALNLNRRLSAVLTSWYSEGLTSQESVQVHSHLMRLCEVMTPSCSEALPNFLEGLLLKTQRGMRHNWKTLLMQGHNNPLFLYILYAWTWQLFSELTCLSSKLL